MRDRAHIEKDPFLKDRSVLLEGDRAWLQHKSKRSVVKDYSMEHQVTMEWDMNEDSVRERMFILRIDDQEVILDWEEVLRVGRFI